jgi:hypothetical protein
MKTRKQTRTHSEQAHSIPWGVTAVFRFVVSLVWFHANTCSRGLRLPLKFLVNPREGKLKWIVPNETERYSRWVSMKIQSYGLSIIHMLCWVRTLVQISPPLIYYGIWARIAWAWVLFISSVLEYRWNFNRTGCVLMHMSMHMLQHMYVVQSADACANLSAIEITWYLGKNCMSVSTVHIIHPRVSIECTICGWNSGTFTLQ